MEHAIYLLALALGERHDGFAHFGRMIREARIHFAAVIEEARIASLETSAIAAMLGKSHVELSDSIRPDLRARVEELLSEAARIRAKRRDVGRSDAPFRASSVCAMIGSFGGHG